MRKVTFRQLDLDIWAKVDPKKIVIMKAGPGKGHRNVLLNDVKNLTVFDEAMNSVAKSEEVTKELQRVEELLSRIETLEQRARPEPKSLPGSFIVDLLLPSAMSADFVANLEALYPAWVEKYGIRKAKWLWRKDCAMVILGTWINYGLTLFDRIKSIKIN